MSAPVTLQVEFHQQEEFTYCGAACAQMILYGMDMVHYPIQGPPDQDDLHSLITNVVSPGWVSEPRRLSDTIETQMKGLTLSTPHGVNNFVPYGEDSPVNLSRRVVWSVQKYGVAPAVLVWGKLHWLVVNGYDTVSHLEATSAMSEYSILGFYIHNPVPVVAPATGMTVANVPPPHGPQEGVIQPDRCGDGFVKLPSHSATDSTGYNRGVAAHHVSFQGWTCEYLDRPISSTDVWNNKYVTVCADDSGTPESVKVTLAVTCPPDNLALLSHDDAAILAWGQMKDVHQLHQKGVNSKLWGQVLVQASPFVSGFKVQEVIRSDTKRLYYLIMYKSPDGREPLVARVDPLRAYYIESVVVHENAKQAIADIDPRETNIRHSKAISANPGNVIDLSLYTFLGELVWRPCIESFTPFEPFFHFLDPHNQQELFVRASDRIAFKSLSFDVDGGH